jgi:hypothetical protein
VIETIKTRTGSSFLRETPAKDLISSDREWIEKLMEYSKGPAKEVWCLFTESKKVGFSLLHNSEPQFRVIYGTD